MKLKNFHIVFILCCGIFFSCNPTATLTEGEYLVNKNKILVDNDNVSTYEIGSYIKQKPNRKILGVFRFHLGIYNFINPIKTEKRKAIWLEKTERRNEIRRNKGRKLLSTDKLILREKLLNIGEQPVILDTLLTSKSVKQIRLYMHSKGYFNAEVQKNIEYKKKKAAITYTIASSDPYYIRSINYHIDDPNLRSTIVSDSSNCVIKRNSTYDADKLQEERVRITADLKDNGYFYFSKEYITYTVDTTLGNHQLDITVFVRDPVMKLKDYPDSTVTTRHKKYLINNIYIYPQYSSLDLDTTLFKKYPYFALPRKKTSSPSLYTFVYKDTIRIKPKTITQSVFFKQGNYYKLTDVEDSYNSLMDLKLFKFVNIQFSESPDTVGKEKNLLDCNILLTRSKIQSFSVETEATNSAGNLGVAGNLVYQNKNILRGAEILKFKIRGAMEVQKVFDSEEEENGLQQILPFNTVETGADLGLTIPKFFLMPVRQERFSKYFMPKTNIDAGLNYQSRPDYTRYIANFTYSWQFKASSTQKVIFYPADVNSVKIYPSKAFADTIAAINDPKIRNSYMDHLISAGRFSYTFNNQQIGKSRDFDYLKANAEWSGNLLWAYKWTALKFFGSKDNTDDGHFEVDSIRFSQYFRADADYRHYFVFDEFNTLILRVAAGFGVAYGNTAVMPFEKSFYAGGSNSVRAWKIYSLGPGGDNTTSNLLNKTGDISLLGNIEYRFPVVSYLKSALFIDAGNIWLMKKNENIPMGEITPSFYKQIAVGTGFGLRFDFSFFILRLDFSLRSIDPAKPEGQRWVMKYIKPKDFTVSLGIGYPF